MRACWREIPRIRAERLLAWSDASAYPHMTPDGRTNFRQSLIDTVQGVAANARQSAQFTFNGARMNFVSFKRAMKRALGSGLEQ